MNSQWRKRIEICKQLLQNTVGIRYWKRIITCDKKNGYFFVILKTEDTVVQQDRFRHKVMLCIDGISKASYTSNLFQVAGLYMSVFMLSKLIKYMPFSVIVIQLHWLESVYFISMITLIYISLVQLNENWSNCKI